MARTRIISQNKAVYAGNIAGGSTQLHRIDTFSFEVDQAAGREDIREFGQLARIGTENTSEITPTLSFGYFLGDGENEELLGLTNNASAQMISGILTEDPASKERNIYVGTTEQGLDAVGGTITDSIGFGNSSLTSYSASFAVGEIPRVDVEMQCSNIVFADTNVCPTPAVDSDFAPTGTGATLPTADSGLMDYAVLRPQDVKVNFLNDEISAGDNIGVELSGICVQSATIEIPLARETVDCLGKERGTKYLEFPINVTASLSALVSDFKAGSLASVLTGAAGNDRLDLQIQVENKAGNVQHTFELKQAVLDSQSFSVNLDDNETVDLTFSAQIGGADTTNEGLFWTAV